MTLFAIIFCLEAVIVAGFHYEIFKPNIRNRHFSYLQGLSCNDRSMLLGTNCGSLISIGKNERGELVQKWVRDIGVRNIQKIYSDDEYIIARLDTDNFVEKPFGESVIIDHTKSIKPIYRIHHTNHLIYDCFPQHKTYVNIYSNGQLRKCTWNDYPSESHRHFYDTTHAIKNLNNDETIHLACHTPKKIYMITSNLRFGWLTEECEFVDMHDVSFLGMPTSIHIKHARDETIFVYIGTSSGSVVFLQFNGPDCVIRNKLQISESLSSVTQISSNYNGQTIYASTADCYIVGFNMISFEITFRVKTTYDQFHSNTDNFMVKKNSIITYDNKIHLICYIL